eukprot:365272-Chlamydomonas_euryale.AAC.20
MGGAHTPARKVWMRVHTACASTRAENRGARCGCVSTRRVHRHERRLGAQAGQRLRLGRVSTRRVHQHEWRVAAPAGRRWRCGLVRAGVCIDTSGG